MKTLQNVFIATLVAGFSLSASAQTSIKDMIDAGTYYQDDNYMWYEFTGDDVDSEYELWGPVTADLLNGWLLGWPMNEPPSECTLELDEKEGLVTKVPFNTNDNGFTAPSLKIGTPQLKLNTADYPIIAVKFSHIPKCGEGGWQDGDETKEKMYGGTRLHIVERAETHPSAANSDFWLRIPRNQADANDMITRSEDDWNDWLTIYSATNPDATFESTDAVYIFNLEKAVSRNHGGKEISAIEAACIDYYLLCIDVLGNDYLAVEWIRSFYDINDAIEYTEDLYGDKTGISSATQSNIKVTSENGKIVVDGVDVSTVEVYNLQGQKVAAETANEVELTKGLYIVNVTSGNSTEVFKVLNK